MIVGVVMFSSRWRTLLLILGFLLCLDHCTFKKQRSGRVYYTFHAYSEVRQFEYCLLSRSRKLSSLTPLDDWESYMDSSKLDSFRRVSSDDFLNNHEFGVELHRSNTGEVCEFRNRCREFVDRLVDVILSQQVVSSDFLQRLYCLCPELLLEGDDRHVFRLFSRLVRVLERCGCLSGCDARASLEEFTTFVVDASTRHRESEKSAEQIEDVTTYLLSDYSFMSRRSLVRVLEVCCLVIDRPQKKMPNIEIDLKDCAVSVAVVTSSLRCVHSLVSSPGYKQGAFFTQGTKESVRYAIASSRDFMSCASFDPWESVSCGDRSAFVKQYSSVFDAYLSRRKSEATKQLHNANRQPRHVRFSESGGSGGSSVCSSPRTVLPASSFAVASPGSSSEAGTSGQHTYTAESVLVAILGQRKGAKPYGKESTVRKEGLTKGTGKDLEKEQEKDARKSSKPAKKRPGAKS